jgi:hypothetical protein
MIFFPSVHVADPKGTLCLSIGFFDFSGSQLFELSSEDTTADSGDIEFL